MSSKSVVNQLRRDVEDMRQKALISHDQRNAEKLRADECQSRLLEAEKAASIAQSDLDVERRKNERLRAIIQTLGEVVSHAFMRVPAPNYTWVAQEVSGNLADNIPPVKR